jgi:hypothetical protein
MIIQKNVIDKSPESSAISDIKADEQAATDKNRVVFKCGINAKVVGKTNADKLSYSGAWSTAKWGFSDLAQHINLGHPWMPALIAPGKNRKKENIIQFDLLALDFDNGLTIAEGLERLLIHDHAGLVIESASSSPEHEKFRVVFAFHPNAKLANRFEYEICLRYMMKLFPEADPNCTDASRFYFGAPGREAFLLNETVTLPEDFVTKAKACQREQDAARQAKMLERKLLDGNSGENADETKKRVIDALQYLPGKDQGFYHIRFACLAALVAEYGEDEAIALAENSPLHSEGSWDVPMKVASLGDGCENPATLGTIFHHAKQNGYRAGKGFKPAGQVQLSDRDQQIARRDANFLKVLPLLKIDHSLSETENRSIQYYDGFAPSLDLSNQTILLAGKFAAGKTEAILRSLISRKGQQIVWITGRNGLLRDTQRRAEAMGFDCYHFQDDVSLHQQMLRTGQPGVYFMADESLKEYHVGSVNWRDTTIVIDEFKGVRSQVIKKPLLPEFERMVSECKTLIVADAFLSDADAKIIARYRGSDRAIYDQVPGKHDKKITWVETRTKAGEVSLSHDGVAFDVLKKEFLPYAGIGDPYAVVVDSLLTAQNIRSWAINQGIPADKIMLLSSITPELSGKVLAGVDAQIEELKPCLIIGTPTIESGIDIQTPVRAGFASFCGVLHPTQALQMMGRFRQCSQWTVSAPRRAIETEAGYLSETRIKKLLNSLPGMMQEAGADANPSAKDGWGVWQREIEEPSKAFNSEYIRYLLEENYQTVETAEYKNDQDLWKQYCSATKEHEAKAVLTADIENGLKIVAEQRAPRLDSEIWDVELADSYHLAPKVWDNLIAQYSRLVEEIADCAEMPSVKSAYAALSKELPLADAEETALAELSELQKKLKEVIDTTKALLSGRAIAKMKRFLQAEKQDPDHDWYLGDLQKAKHTNYSSGHFKAFQYQGLYRALGLRGLARRSRTEGEKPIPHENAFLADSEEIKRLYELFKANARLQNLFPLVECLNDFWKEVKRAMAYFGFQSVNGNYRVASDQPVPNGKDRNGNQRFSTSAVKYFVGWYRHQDSGSSVWRENYELIREAIEELLEKEKQEKIEPKRDKAFLEELKDVDPRLRDQMIDRYIRGAA